MSRVTTPPQAQPMSSTTSPSSSMGHVPGDKVAKRAYEKWLKRGCGHGCDMQDWLEAEAEVKSEMSKSSGSSTPTRR